MTLPPHTSLSAFESGDRSQKLPSVSLDLRAWASKEEDFFIAGIFARQDGTVPKWKNIGSVATVEEGRITQAVAKQYELIARWAYEVQNRNLCHKALTEHVADVIRRFAMTLRRTRE